MGTAQRRQREKHERRHDILAAARRLFREQGFARTTMPQIAAALDLAPGTLYLYFASKEALYVELLVEGYALLVERLEGATLTRRTARRQASDLVDAFLAFAREYPQYFEIIFFVLANAGRSADQLASEQARTLAALEERCKAVVRRVLEAAAASAAGDRGRTRPAGAARAGAPRGGAAQRAAAVDATWSMLAGLVLFFGKEDDVSFARVAAAAKRLLLDGALAGAGD